ncbi:MAG: type pilus modification protein PilV [Rhodoferax sp.]|nr:type pilus modification protein PilV [Rhodoferax sp.]
MKRGPLPAFCIDPSARLRHSRGVTLVEVLVAVIVLSIGLLGIAGLQVATAKYKIGSSARSSIAILLSDFTDRVRTNPEMAGPNWQTGGIKDAALSSSDVDDSKYTYQATWTTQQNVTDDSLTSQINAVPKDSAGVYLPQDLAAWDVLSWRKRVRESLPQGAVFVAGNRLTGIDVTFMWLDKDNTDKTLATNDGSTTVSLVAAKTCSTANTESGIAQQTCCPSAATVPDGVRCTRFSFMP